jgi:hypothetical protein
MHVCLRGASRHGSGFCNNHHNLHQDEIERRFSAGLRRTPYRRAAMERFLKGCGDERCRLAGSKVDMIERLDRRLGAIEGKSKRTASLLIKGILDEEKRFEQMCEGEREADVQT